jgi:hypothetical protein
MNFRKNIGSLEIEDFRDENDKVVISLLIGSGLIRFGAKLELWKLRIVFGLFKKVMEK